VARAAANAGGDGAARAGAGVVDAAGARMRYFNPKSSDLQRREDEEAIPEVRSHVNSVVPLRIPADSIGVSGGFARGCTARFSRYRVSAATQRGYEGQRSLRAVDGGRLLSPD
jgi:hypothetical protein